MLWVKATDLTPLQCKWLISLRWVPHWSLICLRGVWRGACRAGIPSCYRLPISSFLNPLPSITTSCLWKLVLASLSFSFSLFFSFSFLGPFLLFFPFCLVSLREMIGMWCRAIDLSVFLLLYATYQITRRGKWGRCHLSSRFYPRQPWGPDSTPGLRSQGGCRWPAGWSWAFLAD